MKKIFYSILMLCGAFAFASCDNETVVQNIFPPYSYPYYIQPGTTNSNGEYAITFGSYTPAATRTIASGGLSGLGYDEFNLFAWNPAETIMNPFKVVATAPGQYAYVGAAPGQDTLYFKNVYESYKFIGVLPTALASVKNSESVDVSNVRAFLVDNEASTDTPDEFLYCKTTVARQNYKNAVILNFKHGNAKMYLKFKSDDANTQIIDFTPYTPGSPAQAAWDETVDVTSYQITATTVPTLGPLLSGINISDDDIAFINSKYTASKGFTSYQSSNVITGNLDENMWEYLNNKYPSLSSIDLGNWGSYASNSNMRLIHIDKSGQKTTAGDSYRGVWVNVQSVNWNNPTTTQTVIHHDAVPAVPESGHKGIIVLPATSVLNNGSDAVLSSLTATADVNIPISGDGATYTETSTMSELTFSVPGANAGSDAVYSPTTFYSLPKDAAQDGLTIKFSYVYKGTIVYDTRVWIPAESCQFDEGKIYTYTIFIKGLGNGTSDPSDADEDDPIVKSSNGISLQVNILDYENYIDETYEIE